MRHDLIAIVLIANCIVAIGANAQIAVENEAYFEREGIAAARRDAESRYSNEEAACYQRFAVNECLREANARLRAVLTDLRYKENALTELERERRKSKVRPTPLVETLAPVDTTSVFGTPTSQIFAPIDQVAQPQAVAKLRPLVASTNAGLSAGQDRKSKAAFRAKVAREKAQEAEAKKRRLVQRKKEKTASPGLTTGS